MEKCNFNYLCNQPTLDDIKKLIIQLNEKYSPQFRNIKALSDKVLLNYDKDCYVELIKGHKKIVLSLIDDVINFFPQFSNIPHIIFIHGSFSKSLNRINSDVDLNILYPNSMKDIILPIEEIITIIIQKVMGYSGRDKIHTMMLYTVDDLNNNLIESTEECAITFPDKQTYTYNCRKNYDEIMYRIKNSSREYNDFCNYINGSISESKCEEWCYSYEELRNNCKKYNIYEMLSRIEKNNINVTDYMSYNGLIKELLDEIDNYNFEIDKVDNISEVNKNLKVKNLRFIYATMSIIRRYLFINLISIKGLDFFEIFSKNEFIDLFTTEEMKKIENSIFKYLWQLSRLEDLFIKSNINFSSRNYDIFNRSLIFDMYKEFYCEELIYVQNEVTDNLHKSLKKILERLKYE